MNELPNTGFIRLKDVLRFIPVSRSHFWVGVREGWLPKPIKIGERITAWSVQDIRKWIDEQQPHK